MVAHASIRQKVSYLQAYPVGHGGETFDNYSDGNDSFLSPRGGEVVFPCANSEVCHEADKISMNTRQNCQAIKI